MRAFLRKLPFFADLFRHIRSRRGQFMRPRRSVSGFWFVGMQEQISETYEHQIASFLLKSHQRFGHFINAGANTGYWPVFLRHHGFDKKITLIEPDQLNLVILKRNLKINQLENITIEEIAVGNSSGVIELHGFGTGISAIKGWAGGSSKRVQRVRIAPIDEVLSEDFSPVLVLIDVEGFELEVLRGATKLLEGKSEFLIEIAAFEHQPEGVAINPNFFDAFAIMKKFGFNAFGWVPDYQSVTDEQLGLIAKQELSPAIQMYHFKKLVG